MAAGSTYTPIATQSVSAQSTVSFTSIPSTYTDLILVAVAKSSTAGSGANNYRVQFNGDTATNYSETYIAGNGTTASSGRDTSSNVIYIGDVAQTSGVAGTTIIQIMNYSNATTYKSVLGRGNVAGTETSAAVGLWRSTAAINRVDIFMTSATVTGDFTLYGIAAA